jgi:hypothetical protein
MSVRQEHKTREDIRASVIAGLDEFVDSLTDELWEVQNMLEYQDAELAALRGSVAASSPEPLKDR